MKKVLFCAGAILAASAASAATVSYNFDADQSASFVVRTTGDVGESIANFSFNYAAHTGNSTGTVPVAITTAPNSVATNTGLWLQANQGPGAVALDGVTVYPDVTGLNLAAGNWQMTFDVWSNYNGDATGATGSTTTVQFGAAGLTTVGNAGNFDTGNDGFTFGLVADAGSSVDYRYFEGAPLAPQYLKANFFGTNAQNVTAGDGWSLFFPNDGVAAGSPPAGAARVGASGKQWVTVRLTVSNGGADRTLELKKASDAGFTVVSSVTAGAGAFTNPSISMTDTNATVANPLVDQFVVIDNLVITDTPGSSVAEWSTY